MPYTILPDGSIQTDDLTEAIRISKALRNGGVSERRHAPPPPPAAAHAAAADNQIPIGGIPLPDEAERLQALASEITDKQRDALRTLRDKGRMTAAAMMVATGTSDGNGIGGIMAPISRRAEKLGIQFSDLVLRIVEGSEKVYVAQPMLRRWTSL